MESFPSSSSYWWERIRTYSRGFVLLFWTYRQSQQTHSYVSTIVILAPESFFVCTCIGVHACIIIYNRLLARHVINRSWESPHSYNISAVRAEMNRVQRVKDQSHGKTTRGQMSTLGGIFSPVSEMHGHILMKLIRITHCQVHMTLATGHRQHFP